MSTIINRLADVLVATQIGQTRYRTPEGYLFCDGVRIARTGPLMYRADEMPELEPQNNMVVMERDADVLFSPETISSFQGKDVTIDHPDELLTPETWRREAVGTVLNPRRGEGIDHHYLLADLLIKDQRAIDSIEDGLVEVSCGYDGERESLRPGQGRFKAIIGNHVALVERGRCGPSCAIGDDGEKVMAVKKRSTWDRLRTAFMARDEAAFNEELETAQNEMKDEDPQRLVIEVRPAQAEGESAVENELAKDEDPVAPADPIARVVEMLTSFGERLDRIEAGVAKNAAAEAAETQQEVSDEEETMEPETEKDPEEVVADEEPEETDEENKEGAPAPVMDRAAFKGVVAKAEILAPGVKIPTFDAKASRKTIADAMCGLRRKALEAAYADPKRRAFVTQIVGDKPAFDKMPCPHMTVVFDAASALAKAANNAPRVSLDRQLFSQGPMTPARYQEMIAANRKGEKIA